MERPRWPDARCYGVGGPRGGGGVGKVGSAMEWPRRPDASGVGRAGRMHLWSAYMGRMRRWSGCARQMLQWSERVARMQWWSQPRCSNEEMTILSFFLSYGRWR
jgi:hypothetical protein